ncbi:pimeloyl-ACP methyl ester carboxylesterase [Nocardioides albertanoniae]|uniref:Pimeloyl-ACP methyl ester carboxylesterase n=1 Tax=Nocardioides albertanoniae TaxID=1175486 RepID=A0A543A9C2_9ACTN|nr:alpha/beta hydrolase [Nocardioides albertanoniae]TQL69100.1 pimeloyl-ACP methyl ester carboxylesterase [Nocardioides albertanoniae]
MLAYERTGSGEPLLLIHGIAHRRQAWDPIVARLADEFDVVTVDLPGHGESPSFDLKGRTVREAVTDELNALRVELRIEQPHVVGNSLGGLLALEMADAGHARSVTALSPAGFWLGKADYLYIRGLFAGVQAMARPLAPVAGTVLHNDIARTLAFAWVAAHPDRLDPDAAADDTANMVASRKAIRTFFSAAYRYPGAINPDVPTTIAWATRDLTLLPYQAIEARRRVPHATHRWLPGCGHMPMSDDPDLVADVIRETTRTPRPAPSTV